MTIAKPKRPKLPAWCLKISISSRVWILVCNAVIHRTKVIFILSYDWGVGTDETSSLSISSFPIQSICSNQFSLMSEWTGPRQKDLITEHRACRNMCDCNSHSTMHNDCWKRRKKPLLSQAVPWRRLIKLKISRLAINLRSWSWQ